jgi:cyclopropane-fatty-acyl-phospholipid synthase
MHGIRQRPGADPIQTGAPGASAAAIQYHYDLSDDFYALWLDPSLTYSAGIWSEGADLATAQAQKIDWHLQSAGVRPGTRLLDVGCGWGALLRRAVERCRIARGIGLTLSAAQAAWIAAAPPPNTEVRLESWSDHQPDAPYDAIVSIGAFEHFARPGQPLGEKLSGYRQFFAACHAFLTPGGRMSLQTITYENADVGDFNTFFSESVFPESDLPHLWEIAAAVHGLFEIQVLRNDRADYVRTLRSWRERLRARRDEAVAIVGADAVTTYERYFDLLTVGFHTGRMNLARIVMQRIDAPSKPLEILERTRLGY